MNYAYSGIGYCWSCPSLPCYGLFSGGWKFAKMLLVCGGFPVPLTPSGYVFWKVLVQFFILLRRVWAKNWIEQIKALLELVYLTSLAYEYFRSQCRMAKSCLGSVPPCWWGKGNANFDRGHSRINERADDPTTWPAQHKRKSIFL